MLAVFSPIFVLDTKIAFLYNFVASLRAIVRLFFSAFFQ